MTITVVLADDQEMVRIGFAMILGAAPDVQVVGQASDGVEAVSVIAETRPDVALLDIRMPRLDGIEVCRRVTEAGTRAVMVTTFGEPDYVDAALACGFLLKDAGPDLLLAAVRAAAEGDALISPELTVDLLARTRGAGRALPESAGAIGGLTPREREVAQCVARGRTNAEIADELVISLGTVKTHLSAIGQRLGARNRVEIAAAMWAAGVMDVPQD